MPRFDPRALTERACDRLAGQPIPVGRRGGEIIEDLDVSDPDGGGVRGRGLPLHVRRTQRNID
jgi:hypothetical protein